LKTTGLSWRNGLSSKLLPPWVFPPSPSTALSDIPDEH
jgi:hypothetical protein